MIPLISAVRPPQIAIVSLFAALFGPTAWAYVAVPAPAAFQCFVLAERTCCDYVNMSCACEDETWIWLCSGLPLSGFNQRIVVAEASSAAGVQRYRAAQPTGDSRSCVCKYHPGKCGDESETCDYYLEDIVTEEVWWWIPWGLEECPYIPIVG